MAVKTRRLDYRSEINFTPVRIFWSHEEWVNNNNYDLIVILKIYQGPKLYKQFSKI